MHINKKSPVPVYYQLKNEILDKINSGEYTENSLIPSERELSEMLGISRMTVRQALSLLVSDGILYREKGKGTFVSKPKLEQRNVMSFSDTVRSKGMVPTTKVLVLEKIRAPKDVMEILELKETDLIYILKRLRLANNMPMAVEEDYIPEKYCPNLDKHDLTGSLYQLLTDEYSHTINYLENVIEAFTPNKEERDLLKISSTIPILKINVIIHTDSGIKLLYENSKYRSDQYKYNVNVYGNRKL